MLNFNLLAEHTQITWSVSLLLLQSLPAASHISPAIYLYVRVCASYIYGITVARAVTASAVYIHIYDMYAVYIYYIRQDKASAMRQKICILRCSSSVRGGGIGAYGYGYDCI